MSFSLPGLELSRMRRSTMTWLAITLVLLIPAIYGTLLVLSSWDSANRVSALPAVIFSGDEPVEVATPDGSTQKISAGSELISTLTGKEDAGFAWDTAESASAARAGLERGDYYAAILVPRNFSASIGSSTGEDPTRAQLTVLSNDANGYVVGQVTRAVSIAVRAELSSSIAERYLQNVFVGFSTVREGMDAAAEGASRVSEGGAQARDGGAQLVVGLGTLRAGADRLAAGLDALSAGNGQLSAGMDLMRSETAAMPAQIDQMAEGSGLLLEGSRRVAEGAGGVAEGAQRVNEGSATLAAGTGALVEGSGQLTAGAAELAPGAAQLAGGTAQLAAGSAELREKTATLAPGAAELAAGSEKLAVGLRKISQLTHGITGLAPIGLVDAIMKVTEGAGFDTIADGAERIAAGAATLNEGAPALRDGIIRLDDGTQQANAGAQRLSAGAEKLHTGALALNEGIGRVDEGAQRLHEGADRLGVGTRELGSGSALLAEKMGLLDAGVRTLHEKTPELVGGIGKATDAASLLAAGSRRAQSGSTELAAGALRAETGAQTLDEGLGRLAEGSAELATKLGDGAQKVPSYSAEQGQKLASVVAAPVQTTETKTHAAPHYGQGMAPFFIPMALWIGGIALFFLVRPLSARAVASAAGPWRVALSGALPGMLCGAVQGLALAIVLEAVIGLSAAHALASGAFIVLIGIVFTLYNHVCLALLGGRGRIVSLLLLILQLASCAGTYPAATSPGFFQAIAPFLPMTYATEGIRHLVTGDLSPAVLGDVLALLVFMAIGLGLVVLAVVLGRNWSIARLHPTLKL
ncbi:YhgE/Pip domain-containing protein [Mycetocola spongiae]|uniref:YhgE/Pip domain-containing protein n=1 Tax=Mycetocola spongiae TaxID=2859226 RepID=UPI001CF53838|nr:YhgE/Pip domain-containing protein [Mycetocola spongiae]UCR87931.1 YhgE/Pip domain-containing protein [Mycetocola spongiae]